MTGKKQISILTAVAALAVSAAPVASAADSTFQDTLISNFRAKPAPPSSVLHDQGRVRGVYAGHYRDGDFRGVTDGTSNTLIVG